MPPLKYILGIHFWIYFSVDQEVAVLQKQSAASHQQLEQLRQEVAGLQPLYSPTAPQDSDLWKLQMEVSFIKGW